MSEHNKFLVLGFQSTSLFSNEVSISSTIIGLQHFVKNEDFITFQAILRYDGEFYVDENNNRYSKYYHIHSGHHYYSPIDVVRQNGVEVMNVITVMGFLRNVLAQATFYMYTEEPEKLSPEERVIWDASIKFAKTVRKLIANLEEQYQVKFTTVMSLEIGKFNFKVEGENAYMFPPI